MEHLFTKRHSLLEPRHYSVRSPAIHMKENSGTDQQPQLNSQLVPAPTCQPAIGLNHLGNKSSSPNQGAPAGIKENTEKTAPSKT